MFSTQQRPNVFVSDAWRAPAAYHPPFWEHCRDHRSDFMAQSLVLLIDICRGLGISPLRIKGVVEFFRADLAFFSFFLYKFGFLVSRYVLIASGTEIFWRVSLKIEVFIGRSFP